MSRIIIFVLAFIILIHGLIHLMGFVAYWPLAEMKELPYKTTLLGSRWDIGATGMRIYSLLWLLTAVLFAAAVLGLVFQQPWWWPLMWGAVLLSILVCMLDWGQAFRGAIISGLILVGLLLLLGFRIQPSALAAYPGQTPPLQMVGVPDDLPAPVARYYETIAGEEIPLIETAVLTGRGTLRVNGIAFPSQFRMVHDVGQDYRQYFSGAYYGRSLLVADEYYVDGHATLNTPMGVIENDPRTDAASNLALWGIAMAMPSAYLVDPRVRWEAIDEHSARLIIPSGDEENSFTVNFDPETGLVTTMDTMRFYNDEQGEKAWRLQGYDWETIHGVMIPTTLTVTWLDEGTPWLVSRVEDVQYNVAVDDYIDKGEAGFWGE